MGMETMGSAPPLSLAMCAGEERARGAFIGGGVVSMGAGAPMGLMTAFLTKGVVAPHRRPTRMKAAPSAEDMWYFLGPFVPIYKRQCFLYHLVGQNTSSDGVLQP